MASSTEQRISDLQRKLAARKGNPAFSENIKAIETEIARLQEAQP